MIAKKFAEMASKNFHLKKKYSTKIIIFDFLSSININII